MFGVFTQEYRAAGRRVLILQVMQERKITASAGYYKLSINLAKICNMDSHGAEKNTAIFRDSLITPLIASWNVTLQITHLS
jgi:hypothetical protein